MIDTLDKGHAIDQFTFRAYRDGKDFTITQLINQYGLIFFLTLKDHDNEILVRLGSAFPKLLKPKDLHVSCKVCKDLYFVYDDSAALLGAILHCIDLGPDDGTKPNKAITEVCELLDQVLSHPKGNNFFNKLIAKDFENENVSAYETKTLVRSQPVNIRKLIKKLINLLCNRVSQMSIAEIAECNQKIYEATINVFQKVESSIHNQFQHSVPSLPHINRHILSDYTFRSEAENDTLTVRDLVNLYAVPAYLLYHKVFKYPYFNLGTAIAEFANEHNFDRKRWQERKCVTTYSSLINLSREIGFWLHGTLDKATRQTRYHEQYNALCMWYNWMTSHPDFTDYLTKLQRPIGQLDTILTTLSEPGISEKEKHYAITVMTRLYTILEAMNLIELKMIQDKIYTEACSRFLDLNIKMAFGQNMSISQTE